LSKLFYKDFVPELKPTPITPFHANAKRPSFTKASSGLPLAVGTQKSLHG